MAITFRGETVALAGVGRFTYEPDSPPVTPRTIYDLASLTKVLATTAACMLLYERDVFRLDQEIVAILPQFAGADARRGEVTFRMLLAHSSGLPAYMKLFHTAQSRNKLVEQAMGVHLIADPDKLRAVHLDP